MKRLLGVLLMAWALVLSLVGAAFAAGEPFSTTTVDSMYTQGSGVWTLLQYPVILALGIVFVLFVVRWGYGRIVAAFRRH